MLARAISFRAAAWRSHAILPRAFVASPCRCMAAGSPTEVSVREDVSGPGSAPVPHRHTMTTGRHTFVGDLMPAAGGTDAGPSPKELALLSIGLCTSMTIRMFADASKFPLRRVGVVVRENTPEGGHLPDGVELDVSLEGEALSTAQKERLMRAAERCPVKRMMTGGMRDGVTTRLI